jgi:hypothetical protein
MTLRGFVAPARKEALPSFAAVASGIIATCAWITVGRYLPGRYIGECIPMCWNWGPLFVAILILVPLLAVPHSVYRLVQSVVRSSEAGRVRKLAARPTDRSLYKLVTLVGTLSNSEDSLQALYSIVSNCGSLERLSALNPGPWAERINTVLILCAQTQQAELVLPLMTVLSRIGTDASLDAIRQSEMAFAGSPTCEMVREQASRARRTLSERLAADRAGAQLLRPAEPMAHNLEPTLLRPSAGCGSDDNLLRASDQP